jgi:hypothetical protein
LLGTAKTSDRSSLQIGLWRRMTVLSYAFFPVAARGGGQKKAADLAACGF